MQSRLKYDSVKQEKTDKGDNVILTKKIYSQETGEVVQEVESMFDPTTISDRIAALQEEITNLQALASKIDAGDFDVVEDKRAKGAGRDTEE